ncbi:MAG: tetratricopeptide repeat protein, partial [Rickettsia endosymbiont of Ixodes persulcatus]|nr:tetratricopeptide repeat protein [Rickettsia endosymbiont of Ixodes persulcatus]
AAKKRDGKALEGLESVISRLDDSALQFQLAEVYENNFSKKELALKSFKNLADNGNKKALDRINLLASSSVSCAYELGRSYESSNLYDKAFTYYLIAAKKRDKNSLEGLERAISKLSDATLQFQLAEVYEKSFNKKELALKYFKILADQGDKAALARMLILAKSDANCAYELAKSYESDSSNKEKSYQYYIFAMQNNHSRASNELTSLAESGDAEAQYTLGYLYYHPQQRFTEAIHWCLLAAEQQHDKAINYIKNTIFPSEYYLFLANSYEKGEKVSKDKDKALYFYEKAVAEKDNEAAFRLGQLNQCDNEEKAFDYFVKAAQWGHVEALCYLERLAHERNPEKQLQLFNLYRTLPFNDRHKALYWCQQAIQSSNLQGLALSTAHIKRLFEAKQSINFQQL